MEKNEKYEQAKLELIYFDAKDVIATSTLGGDGKSDGDDYGWTSPRGGWT